MDYHTHVNFSCDSQVTMEDRIKNAIKNNFDEIAITDHCIVMEDGTLMIRGNEYDNYAIKITNLKEKYKDKISIIWGAEVDLEKDQLDITNNFVNKYDLEFVIGSVHTIERVDLYNNTFFENKEKKLAFEEYFYNVYECVKVHDCYNVIGHLDYVNRYGNYKDNSLYYHEYKDIIDQILIELIKKNKGLEVNTSGYKYNLGHVHPQLDILKRYKELGGEILTIGSDAHTIKHLGDHFEDGYKTIKEAGFKYLTRFKNKQISFEKI